MHVQCVKRFLHDIPLDKLASTEPEDFELLDDEHKAAFPSDPRGDGCGMSQPPTEAALPSDPQGQGGSLANNPNEFTGHDEARVHRVYHAPSSTTDDIIASIWNKVEQQRVRQARP